MYIEVEGQNYLITVHASVEKITVSGIKSDYIQISAPANLPQSELLVYLKNNKNQLIKSFNKENKIQKIEIFDQSLSLVIKENLREPYMQNNIIYGSDGISTSAQEQKLKEKLLLQVLMNLIGQWEERLGYMLNEIKLRLLKTNHYTVCYKTNNMTFSKSLINRNLNFISYIVATAVLDTLKINDGRREQLLDKHVKDWKFSKKINSYDRFN